MSVVIRGMKMPTSCSECACCGYYGKGDHVCDITGKEVVYELSLEKRLDDCPLIELSHHGRLIDIDALPQGRVEWEDVLNAPTIIEAEESE